jgi:hypothetical protein
MEIVSHFVHQKSHNTGTEAGQRRWKYVFQLSELWGELRGEFYIFEFKNARHSVSDARQICRCFQAIITQFKLKFEDHDYRYVNGRPFQKLLTFTV